MALVEFLILRKPPPGPRRRAARGQAPRLSRRTHGDNPADPQSFASSPREKEEQPAGLGGCGTNFQRAAISAAALPSLSMCGRPVRAWPQLEPLIGDLDIQLR